MGTAFGLQAKSISDGASRWDTFDQNRYDEGKADERNMLVLGGIGAAAFVTGGVLYYVGHRAGASTDSNAQITVAPIVGPSQIAFAASGWF